MWFNNYKHNAVRRKTAALGFMNRKNNMKSKWLILLLSFAVMSFSSPKDEANQIESITAKTDSIKQVLNGNFKIYCKVNKNKILQVKDTANWPENVEITYNLLLDSIGNLIKYVEIPTSESGDWNLELSYYFNKNGNLQKFVYSLSAFANECTEILRDTRQQYYKEKGNIIYKNRFFTDANFKPIDTTGCYVRDIEYNIYKNTKEIKSKYQFK